MQFKTTQITDQEVQLMERYVDVINTIGENEIAAVPGRGRRIVLVYAIIQNTTQTNTVIIMGAGSAANPIFRFNTEQWTALTFFSTLGREVRLPENTALSLNLGAAIAHNVNVYYFTEDV